MTISPWLPILPGTGHHGHGPGRQPGRRRAGRRARSQASWAQRSACGATDTRPDDRRCPSRIGRTATLLQVEDLHVEFPLGRPGRAGGARGRASIFPAAAPWASSARAALASRVTALSLIGLLDAPGRITRGAIRFDGRDLTRLTESTAGRVARTEDGDDLPESGASLNPVLTIGYQMAESLRRHRQLAAQPEAAAREALARRGDRRPRTCAAPATRSSCRAG